MKKAPSLLTAFLILALSLGGVLAYFQLGRAEDPSFTIKNVKVVGDSFHKNRDYYRAMKLAARVQDRVGLADLITDRFPVSETLQALRCVESGAAIKAVIDPSTGGSNG